MWFNPLAGLEWSRQASWGRWGLHWLGLGLGGTCKEVWGKKDGGRRLGRGLSRVRRCMVSQDR